MDIHKSVILYVFLCIISHTYLDLVLNITS